MDPIYDLPADLPKHQPVPQETAASRIVTTWPLGTFVENLAILSDGGLAVSIHSTNSIERIDLTTGEHSVLARLSSSPAGLVVLGGVLYAVSGNIGQPPATLWKIVPGEEPAEVLQVSDALFLNGLTCLTATSLLVADSLLGRLFKLDLETGRATVWFEHELLNKITSFPFTPGANGLKIHKNNVYVTNTDRALFLRIPILEDGMAGDIEIVSEHLRGDDFAFSEDGRAWICTHIENTLEILDEHGARRAVAGPEEGMAGSTAIAFGRSPADRTAAYVTTTGGILSPYQGKLQPAKLVRIELGVAGYPIQPMSLS